MSKASLVSMSLSFIKLSYDTFVNTMFYPENVLDLKNCACNNECMCAARQPASHHFNFLNAAISLHALPLPKPRRFFHLSPIDTSTGISLRLGVFISSFLHVGTTMGGFARLGGNLPSQPAMGATVVRAVWQSSLQSLNVWNNALHSSQCWLLSSHHET